LLGSLRLPLAAYCYRRLSASEFETTR